MIQGPLQVGKELCEAWGLDANKVRAITISVTVDAMPTVVVEMFVGPEHVAMLKKYELYSRDAGIYPVEGVA